MFLNTMKSSLLCNVRCYMPRRFIHIAPALNLYSSSALGIDGYLQSRKKMKEQFSNFADTFRSKMNDFVMQPKNMIFTEDLKNMVHIAEPTDLNLVLNMVKKFNTQNTEFRFGSFIFGPVVMRMFHFLDAPKEALQCFEDVCNSGFFDQQVSYQILLDLLYIHEMYEEMYRVFDVVQQKQLNMTKFPKYSLILVLAACYKENTKKSLDYASRIWSEMANVGTVPVRRASTLFAALALNQGAPHIAMESISMQKQHYVTIRNIKAVALAEMERIEESLQVLKNVMEVDSPEQNGKHTFFEETVSKVRSVVDKSDNKDLKKEFDNVEKALRDRGLINDQTLDQLVTSEITINVKTQTKPRGMPQLPFGQRQRKRSVERTIS